MQNKKVFVSYSRHDSTFVKKFATDLKNQGVNIWLDQLDIPLGAIWDLEIEKAIIDCERVLFIASTSSVQSPNALNEVYSALEDDKTVIPIRIDDCKIPFRLNRLQYYDIKDNYDEGLVIVSKALLLHGTEPHDEADLHDEAHQQELQQKHEEQLREQKEEEQRKQDQLANQRKAQERRMAEDEARQKQAELNRKSTGSNSNLETAKPKGKTYLWLLGALAAVVMIVVWASGAFSSQHSGSAINDDTPISHTKDTPKKKPDTKPISNTNSATVIASDFLALKEAPGINSKRILKISPKEVVQIISKTSNCETIGGVNDCWYKITYNGYQGYAFGGYLQVGY